MMDRRRFGAFAASALASCHALAAPEKLSDPAPRALRVSVERQLASNTLPTSAS
jgi:hypothetical protein